MAAEKSLLDRLRAETRFHRYVADSDRVALAGKPPTLDGYFDYLTKMYGFEAPLESALAVAPLHGLDLSGRMKAAALADDLRAMALPIERLLNLPCCAFASIRTTADALAWLFVSETNRTSHQLFRTYLAHQLPQVLAGSRATQEQTSNEQWHELGAAIDRAVAAHEASFPSLTEAAVAAFDCQHHWFQPLAPSGSVIRAGEYSEQATRRVSEGLRKALRYEDDD